MPKYDYKCKQCAAVFEVEQRIVDDPLQSCRTCDGEVYRLISKGVGISFKGSGFYVTDQGGGQSSTVTDTAKDTVKSSESKASDTSQGSTSKDTASKTPA